MPAHSLPSLRPSPVLATPASSYHPESSLLSLGETIPFLSASLEVPPIAPISPHSPHRNDRPDPRQSDSDSFLLEITPSLASSVPSTIARTFAGYEAASAFAPRPSLLPSSPLLLSSGPSSVRFNFAFVFITTEVLVSTLFDILGDYLHPRAQVLEQARRLRQQSDQHPQHFKSRRLRAATPARTAHAPRPTPRFDPGGPASSSRLFGHTKTFTSASRRHTTHFFVTHVAIPIPL
ncbi:hypothetical protein EDB84DRAFT_1630588 [Lactarius hengduanensis]|nr:hypothetical protein EDB84DRAFT_1630588 [Lactarius hengduanensis]